MSFIENPFADDEEPTADPIVTGSPFGDYDAEQKENEYNALFVRSTTLEQQMRKSDSDSSADVAERVHRTAQLREEFETLVGRQSTLTASARASRQTAAGPSHGVAPHQVAAASAAIREGLSRQAAAQQPKLATLSHAVQLYRSSVLSQTGSSHPAAVPEAPDADEARTRDALHLDTSSIVALVQQLIAMQSSSLEGTDTVLVAALLAQARAALRRYEGGTVSALASYREARAQRRTLSRLDSSARRLGAFLAAPAEPALKKGPRTEASTSVEGREAEEASKDLQREIHLLETAIATMLRDEAQEGPSSATSTPLKNSGPHSSGACRSFAAGLASTLLRLEQLGHEAEVLGREVLFLRHTVLGGAPSVAAAEECSPLSVAVALATSDGVTAAAEARERNAEADLSEGSAAAGRAGVLDAALAEMSAEGSQGPPTSAPIEALLALAEQMLPLQDACLSALASINDQLQTQVRGAALLTQLVAHDVEFDAMVVGRLGDVPAPEVPPPPMDGDGLAGSTPDHVARWYLAGDERHSDPAAAVSALPTLSAGLVSQLDECLARSAPAWRRREAQWQRVQTVLSQMLNLPKTPSGTTVGISAVAGMPPRLEVSARCDIAAALDAELAVASESCDAGLAAITRALRERNGELEKKLSWFGRQPHAGSLKALRTLEGECAQLTQRVDASDALLVDGETAQSELASLQARLTTAKESVAALAKDAQELNAQITSAERKVASLGPRQ